MVDGLVMEFPTRTFAVEVRCVCLARVDTAVKRTESRDHGRDPIFHQANSVDNKSARNRDRRGPHKES